MQSSWRNATQRLNGRAVGATDWPANRLASFQSTQQRANKRSSQSYRYRGQECFEIPNIEFHELPRLHTRFAETGYGPNTLRSLVSRVVSCEVTKCRDVLRFKWKANSGRRNRARKLRTTENWLLWDFSCSGQVLEKWECADVLHSEECRVKNFIGRKKCLQVRPRQHPCCMMQSIK